MGEDGREAIIPLEDKARGVPLLMAAAQELGMTRGENIIDGFATRRINSGDDIINHSENVSRPVINISVESAEGGDIAQKIADAVRRVLSEMSSFEERVSYA